MVHSEWSMDHSFRMVHGAFVPWTIRGYRSFVQRVICPSLVEIPKFDAKPNPNSNPNPMPIRFGQMTLRTSELLPPFVPGNFCSRERMNPGLFVPRTIRSLEHSFLIIKKVVKLVFQWFLGTNVPGNEWGLCKMQECGNAGADTCKMHVMHCT